MEVDEQAGISEQANLIKEAVKTSQLHSIDGLPREAFIKAAVDGIIVYGLRMTGNTSSQKRARAQRDMHQHLNLLDEHERKQAISQANDWLSENLDQ